MEGCSADLDTYCAKVTPGEQRLLACVYAHEDKISQGCEASLGDALLLVRTDIAGANLIGKLCGNDIMAHCGDVVPGDGRIEACLADRVDLSETCSRALLALPRQQGRSAECCQRQGRTRVSQLNSRPGADADHPPPRPIA